MVALTKSRLKHRYLYIHGEISIYIPIRDNGNICESLVKSQFWSK